MRRPQISGAGRFKFFLVVVIGLSSLVGCSTTTVRFTRMQPPEYDIPPNKRLAVLDLIPPDYAPEAGRALASTLVSRLVPTDYYQIVERGQIQNVLREIKFSEMDYVDPATARRAGKIAGADFVIVGEVTAYDTEDNVEYRDVTDRVWTGRYYRDRYGRERRMYRTVTKTIEIRTRQGTVSASFRLVDVETGIVVATDQQTRTFKQSTNPFFVSSELPPRDYILTNLTEKVVEPFITKIAPYKVSERRTLEFGDHPLIKQGVKLAKSGLWREAFETWEEARAIVPEDAAVYNNMAVAAELRGDYDAAETLYKRALDIEPGNSRYMENLRRARHLKKMYENREPTP